MVLRTITIKAIAYVDNTQKRSLLNALLFEETIILAELKEPFPVRRILVSYENNIH